MLPSRSRDAPGRAPPRRLGRAGALAAALALAAGPAAAQAVQAAACPVASGFGYMGQTVLQDAPGAPWLFSTATRLVDADGAPDAYHPADVAQDCGHHGVGLDCPADAGYPGQGWWRSVLVPDPDDPERPYVQPDGPYRGFFVSMTSLRDPDAADPLDPDSYVDASRIPFLVAPAPILGAEGMGAMGDLGYALDLATGRATPFVVADEGPVEPLGEASVAFWKALGGTAPNARDGAGLTPGRFVAVVFPGSGRRAGLGWPIRPARLKAAADDLLAGFGGLDALRACAAAQLQAPDQAS